MDKGILTILGIGMPGMGEWSTILLMIVLIIGLPIYFILASGKKNGSRYDNQATSMVNAETKMSNQTLPKSFLMESVLVTILCVLLLGIIGIIGIIGIVNAARVESRFSAGNYEGASQASAAAKTWTMISSVLAIVGVILFFL